VLRERAVPSVKKVKEKKKKKKKKKKKIKRDDGGDHRGLNKLKEERKLPQQTILLLKAGHRHESEPN